MKKEFGVWFWVHSILLIPAYLSPLLLDWRLIIIGVAVLHIQYKVFGGCILTHLEMGKDKNETFMWYYLSKIYPGLSPAATRVAIRVVVPIFMIVLAAIVQVHYQVGPILL